MIHLYDFNHIDQKLATITQSMIDMSIDFVFLGKGCFPTVDTAKLTRVTEDLFLTRHSRCTEAYLISPNGRQAYLDFFHTTDNHVVIDWDFNMFFSKQPEIKCAWAIPELFSQGSQIGLYKTTIAPSYPL
jgi:hypothetical protein